MDLLNLAADERLNRADLSFGLTEAVVGQFAELAQGVVLGPSRSVVVGGFVPAAASATGPVTVGNAAATNVAFLARNVAGEVVPAQLIYGSNPSVSIDISTFPSGTYGIYVRANLVATATQNRAFWSGADAAEYAKLTPTRLSAVWEARIETAQPAPEWLKIGEATVTAASSGGQGATVSVVDQRPLLFEGSFNSAYAPTWGSATDRSSRRANTITDLGTMVDALKACIVDLKGPGVATWYQKHISGINVGDNLAQQSVTPNRIAIGATTSYLEVPDPTSLYPTTRLNFGANQYLNFSSFTGSMILVGDNNTLFSVGGSGGVGINLGPGLQQTNTPLLVNSLSSFSGGEVLSAYNRGANSARIGLWGSSTASLAVMSQYGFVNESPTARALMGIGYDTNGNVQTFITLRQSSSQSFVFRANANSTSTGDVTTTVSGRNVKVGTDGSVELYGPVMLAQNRRFDGGALGWAAYNCNFSDDMSIGGTQTRTALVVGGTRLTNDGDNSKKYTRVTFNTDLPASAMPMATACSFSVSNTDQRGWRVTAHITDARTVDVDLLSANGDFHWGSFYLLIVNGS